MSLDPMREMPADERAWFRWNDQQSPQRFNVYTVTDTTYTVGDWENVVLVDDDTAAGAVTVSLPLAANNEGRWLYVKKLGSTGNVTVDGDETIDNAATEVISVQYNTVKIVSDGTEWWTL